MKKFTITGFEKHCKEKKYITYKYATINQGYDSYESNMRIVVCYDNVFTSISPNRVYFRSSTGCNMLGFQRVKYILLTEEESSIGDVFNIICESKNGEEDLYTIVADVV